MSDAPERIWAWPADAAGQWSKQLTGGFGTSKPSKKSTAYRRADLPPTREQIMADPRVMALVEALGDILDAADECDEWRAEDFQQAPVTAETCRSVRTALAALTDNEGETE